MFNLNFFVILVLSAATNYLNATTYICQTNKGCGCSKYHTTILNARIVNGETAAVGTWGWIASLQYPSGQHMCGGTVIDKRHILTAAHCIVKLAYPVSKYRVVLGANALSNPSPNAEIYHYSYVRPNPQYDSNDDNGRYDIGIITLNRDIDFSEDSYISFQECAFLL